MAATTHPRTSVIVPARNAAKTLARTLESLLAQTDPSWEALVVDDGSSDGTGGIIAAHAARDLRLHALSGPAAGVSAARNLALDRARGTRVFFLDADDWVDPRFLASMNAALDGAPGAVAAYCNDRRVAPDGVMSPPRSDPRLAAAPFERFARSCPAAMCAVVAERAIVEAVGRFDRGLLTCQDWDLWQRVARTGGRWIHVDEPLSYYRLGENAQTHRVDRMLADAAIVIARGFARDERLAHLRVEHLSGADPAAGGTAALAHALFALWCGAIDCARGGSGAGAIAALGARPAAGDLAQRIAAHLVDGVMVGLSDVPARFAARWNAFGDRVAALVREAGSVWHDPGIARAVQYAFERAVLDADDLAAPRRLVFTLGLAVDLRDPPPLAPPPGIDRVHARLRAPGGARARLDFGVLGAIAPRKWRSLAAAGGVHRAIAPYRAADGHDDAIERLRREADVLAGVLRGGGRPGRTNDGPQLVGWAVHGRRLLRTLAGEVLQRTEGARPRIPALLFRGVAADEPGAPQPQGVALAAFRAQLTWLHGRGYRAISSAVLADARAGRTPAGGSPVLIGVTGPAAAFARAIWPASREAGMPAELFVATGALVALAGLGPGARDTADGAAIVRLAAEGASFGVLFEDAADAFATRALAEALLQSRAILGALAGHAIAGLAVRAGGADERVARLAAECGFRLVLAAGGAGPGGDLALACTEVDGDPTPAVLAAALEAER